ncbi:uncharacterized protein LOC104424924 [Eucalyptus grandis]|uniref:Uncharacterized protein n=2 Tax=Eucalyptus grandis TaxID=71139 RepID=A0ACC3IS52_EUCGR|nr:uncharacterized protein LOC104424924 [Eucalyptus grandis]KAK3404720.1 hypothetical protein EUGRSUZ_K01033 [Eucalyptus grandis]
MVEGSQESPSPKRLSSPLPLPDTVLPWVMSRRRTWVLLFLIVNVVLCCCVLNLENLIFSWYRCQQSSSWWTALEASALLGAAFWALSTAAALTVAVPAIAVAWITVVVGLAFSGKSQRTLLVEGRKASREIAWCICKNSFKEGRVVGVVCAVLGFFALFKKG